jgi:hypothetical protein
VNRTASAAPSTIRTATCSSDGSMATSTPSHHASPAAARLPAWVTHRTVMGYAGRMACR